MICLEMLSSEKGDFQLKLINENEILEHKDAESKM